MESAVRGNEVVSINRKLHRVLDEIQKTEKKLAVWQEHLNELNAQKEILEDAEIIKSVRSMRLDSRELLAVLEGVQNGTVTLSENKAEEDFAGDGSAETMHQEQTEDYGTTDLPAGNEMPQDTALEREDLENESEN